MISLSGGIPCCVRAARIAIAVSCCNDTYEALTTPVYAALASRETCRSTFRSDAHKMQAGANDQRVLAEIVNHHAPSNLIIRARSSTTASNCHIAIVGRCPPVEYEAIARKNFCRTPQRKEERTSAVTARQRFFGQQNSSAALRVERKGTGHTRRPLQRGCLGPHVPRHCLRDALPFEMLATNCGGGSFSGEERRTLERHQSCLSTHRPHA